MNRLPVFGVRFCVNLVPIGLPCLRKQDEGRRIGGLEDEREIQEDERIHVELRDPGDI
ncbi:MAG: hypothetical protein WBX20_03070 [Terrimicrobiaceae bacterium]